MKHGVDILPNAIFCIFLLLPLIRHLTISRFLKYSESSWYLWFMNTQDPSPIIRRFLDAPGVSLQSLTYRNRSILNEISRGKTKSLFLIIR